MAKCERCGKSIGMFSFKEYCYECEKIILSIEEQKKLEEENKRKIGIEKAKKAKENYLNNCTVKFLQANNIITSYNINGYALRDYCDNRNTIARDINIIQINEDVMKNAINSGNYFISKDDIIRMLSGKSSILCYTEIAAKNIDTIYHLIINGKYKEIKSNDFEEFLADEDNEYSKYTITANDYLNKITD